MRRDTLCEALVLELLKFAPGRRDVYSGRMNQVQVN